MSVPTFLHDLRFAIRQLRNSRGFSAVAIATIALTIGANTAMFGLVDGILLRPLPYPEPDRIVRVLERLPSGGLTGISTPNYLDWAKENTVFEYMAAEAGWRATLTGATEPVVIQAARASAHYFDIFGVKPALGRTFLPDEDQPGKDRVVLLSHALWESRFAADSSLLGHDIRLDGEPYTVIGVLPKGGPFDRASARLWTPLAFEPSDARRDFHWLGATAKLKPGVTLQRARAEMDVIGRRLASAHGDTNEGRSVAVDRLAHVLVGPDLRTAVEVLFAGTGLVLLIGCANLTNLALARSIARERETAVRAALGAGRWRLVRQGVTEHVVLALVGGSAGAGVAFVMMKWITSLIPPSALPPAVDIAMGRSALVFTLIVAIGTGLLFGIVPAMRAVNPSLVDALKLGGHATTAGTRSRRVRSALVVAEIALAFVLLVGSGQLMRSFFKLLEVDPGFVAANVLTAGVPVTRKQHPDPVELNTYLASVRAAVDAVPGVRETALTSVLPLRGWGFGLPYAIAGRGPVERADRPSAFFKIVSPSYFHALGIKRMSGRLLNGDDRAGTPRVAVINETLARREFADRDPIGQRILVPEVVPGKPGFGDEVAWEIVGVIAGEKITGLGDEISAGMYVSNEQSPTYTVDLVVRADVPPQSLQKALRAAVDRVNEDQPLSDVSTLQQIVDQSMRGNRVMSVLFAVFAGMALLLATLGIYGVIAYTTAQRTRELGIRAALGASTRHLRMLVVAGGMRLTLAGLAIGFAATFATTGVLSSMLYGVGVRDPLTIAAVAAVLATVAGLACLLPAWRSTRLHPMDALRHQ